ncbi:hypothetical protein SAMN05216431_10316 [Ligilactobacillus sp. WC1T17]|uniref:Uncharacterized protein n=1 Tax=Ligilactobacillus ruminis TaxID=1623 RepID=A0ABY1AA11_9LACO|nr:hypothetical protein SAMN05216431_10316 [Ligilactobacillus ruminis]
MNKLNQINILAWILIAVGCLDIILSIFNQNLRWISDVLFVITGILFLIDKPGRFGEETKKMLVNLRIILMIAGIVSSLLLYFI